MPEYFFRASSERSFPIFLFYFGEPRNVQWLLALKNYRTEERMAALNARNPLQYTKGCARLISQQA
jgi:hypothetical protein